VWSKSINEGNYLSHDRNMEQAQPGDGRSYRTVVRGREKNERLPTRFALTVEAYLSLIRFDLYLARQNFGLLYQKVREFPTRKTLCTPDSIELICGAVDMACIWYCKEVLCLQRSAATACLLRKYGVSAHLVIGAQQVPFKAHAWVEVGGRVVNDKQYVPEMYGILTRC
jgi:hypothetical protein